MEDLVSTNAVVIFSKTYCPYCKMAKEAVAESGAKVDGFKGATVIELDTRKDGTALQAYLAKKTGRSTVPNVFINGKSVGGGDEVAGYLRSGVLPQMISAALHAGTKIATTAENGAGDDVAYFGAGCFWGVELAFQRENGVTRTEVGYANGKSERVTYETVCTGQSGHAEVVKVWYRRDVTSFQRLLELWESRHDVTSKNRQGNDVGTQYRSAVFYVDDQQKEALAKWGAEANARYGGRVVADIVPLRNYCAAEAYHQRYLERRGQSAAKGATAHIRCYG